MTRLPDHDLSVLVEAAAKGATNSWAAHGGGTQWDDMTAGQKNLVRETALPFIFHGTKALAELGYKKPRTITTVDALEDMSNEEFAADIRTAPVTGGTDVDLSRPLAHHLSKLGYRKILTFAGSRQLLEVADERGRQSDKWGEQNHPNGTGSDVRLLGSKVSYSECRDLAKNQTDAATAAGTVTFADIMLEEVFEAVAEEDLDKLRTELIQVAAVAAQWVEAIDRAEARK